jgi:5'-3' exonuclease
MTGNYILIDGSYYIFYRYYALIQWWKRSNPETPLDIPIDNPEFVEKFKKLFVSRLDDIAKRLKIRNPIFIIAKDCPRKNIWRNELTNNYKGSRKYETDPVKNPSPFFRLVYNESLFTKTQVEHPFLEADDCIALIIKKIKASANNIYIIANDHDYLQITDKNIHMFNLKFKHILTTNPKKSLFLKCVLGDKSDNIKGIFHRCGKKTAEKYYDDPNLFSAQCDKHNVHVQYQLNKQLIDFDQIPENYATEFYKTYTTLFTSYNL